MNKIFSKFLIFFLMSLTLVSVASATTSEVDLDLFFVGEDVSAFGTSGSGGSLTVSNVENTFDHNDGTYASASTGSTGSTYVYVQKIFKETNISTITYRYTIINGASGTGRQRRGSLETYDGSTWSFEATLSDITNSNGGGAVDLGTYTLNKNVQGIRLKLENNIIGGNIAHSYEINTLEYQPIEIVDEIQYFSNSLTSTFVSNYDYESSFLKYLFTGDEETYPVRNDGNIVGKTFNDGTTSGGVTRHSELTGTLNGGITMPNDVTGTLTNGVILDDERGLAFDGVDDYATYNKQLFDGISEFTISADIKYLSIPIVNSAIIQERGTAGYNYATQFYYYPTNNELVLQIGNGATVLSLSHAWIPNIDKYYELTATYDGLNSKIYIDGELVATSVNNALGTLTTDDGLYKLISSFQNLNYAHQSIDDVKILDIALTATQVREVYESEQINYNQIDYVNAYEFDLDKESSTYLISGAANGEFYGYENTGSSWTYDTDIFSGLTDLGDYSAPTTFTYDGSYYLISGKSGAGYNGYQWNGVTWVTDSDIVIGIGEVGTWSKPDVFKMNGSMYLISGGSGSGTATGNKWNGSQWVADTAIMNGLVTSFVSFDSEVFEKDGEFYLIAGSNDGQFDGYKWVESTWVSNSSIVTGLTDVGDYSSPTIFYIDDELYLISGLIGGTFNGWNWNGSQWISDGGIISGLPSVGSNSVPMVFEHFLDNTITGEYHNGLKGHSMSFDGSDDYVLVPNPNLKQGDLSVCFWVKPDAIGVGEYDWVISQGTVNTKWNLFFDQGNFRIRGDQATTSDKVYGLDGGIYDDGNFHFYCANYFNNNDAELYIDGLLQTPGIDVFTTYTIDNTDLLIGTYAAGSGHPMGGKIDDITILNTRLSAEEVLELYETGSTSYGLHEHLEGYEFNFENILDDTTTTSSTINGKYGKALEFDGVDDYVSISGTALSSTEGTICLWHNSESTTTSFDKVFGHYNSGSRIYLQAGTTANRFEWVFGNGETLSYAVTDNLNEWNYRCVRYDNGNAEIFNNGYNAGSFTYTLLTSMADFELGALYVASASNYYDGQIDEVRIWDITLTSEEIQKEMNSNKPIKSEGLVASYSFEETGGTTTEDLNHLNSGIIGESAMYFDGVDDYVSFTDTGDLTEFAVCNWFNPSSIQASSTNRISLIGDTSPSNDNFLGFNIGTNVYFMEFKDGTSIASPVGFLDYNVYQHICYVYDSALITFYKNGEYIYHTGTSNKNISLQYLGIGYSSTRYNGSLDDVRIYNTSLMNTADDVIINNPTHAGLPLYRDTATADQYCVENGYEKHVSYTDSGMGFGHQKYQYSGSWTIESAQMQHIETITCGNPSKYIEQLYNNEYFDTTNLVYHASFEELENSVIHDRNEQLCVGCTTYKDSNSKVFDLQALFKSTDVNDGVYENYAFSDGNMIGGVTRNDNIVGSLINGPTWTSRGLEFDGVDDYVSVPTISFNAGDEYSINFIVQTDSLINQGYMGEIGLTRNFIISGGEDITLELGSTGTNHLLELSGLRTDLRHISLNFETYNLTHQLISTYTNGVLTDVDIVLQDNFIIEGIGRAYTNRFIFGQIDDVLILDRALTNTEVQELYKNGRSALSEIDRTEGYFFDFSEGTGTITVGETATGKYGKALEFDGVDDKISMDMMTPDATATALTYCTWAKHNSDMLGTVTSFNMVVGETHTLGFRDFTTYTDIVWRFDNSGARTIQSPITYDEYKDWHYYCGNYWETGATSVQQLYIDGILIDQQNEANHALDYSLVDTLGAHPLDIQHFNGSLDEVRIWDAALSQEEIKAEMESSIPRRNENLVSSFSFEETEGITAYDMNQVAGTQAELYGSVNGKTTNDGSIMDTVTGNDFPWLSNTQIISGLGDVGSYADLVVFEVDNEWYLISGSSANGHIWGGSSWSSDAGIISGLSGSYISPTTFEKDGNLYLINGNFDGDFDGYIWGGSSWSSDAGIISGLPDVGSHSAPTIFYLNDNWYLISGEHDGVFNGYIWGGSSWSSDAGIISGLPDVGSRSKPKTFEKDGNLYLVIGNSVGDFDGYIWGGSSWSVNAEVISGLSDVGTYSTASTFYMLNTWYTITGDQDGTFDGYNLETDQKWFADTNLLNGLPGSSSGVQPEVFTMDGNLYNIQCISSGQCTGYEWNGVSWKPNAPIEAGITEGIDYLQSTVFYKDSTWYLIMGSMNDQNRGYEWTGSAWSVNTAITNGIIDEPGDSRGLIYSSPEVYHDGTDWILISGMEDGTFESFKWVTNAWVSDSSYISGLGDIGQRASPDVFEVNGERYLIAGEYNGVVYGYVWKDSAWQMDLEIINSIGDVGLYNTPSQFEYNDKVYLITGTADAGNELYGFNYDLGSITRDQDITGTLTNGVGVHSAVQGSLENGVTWSTDRGVSFDGVDDYVQYNKNIDLSGSKLTINLFIKTDDATTRSAFRIQSGDYIVLPYNDEAILSFDGGVGGGVSFGNYYDDNWHMITLTWEKNTVNGFKTYLDGVLQNQRTSANINIPNIPDEIYFGSYGGTSEFFDGEIDDVKILDVALTQAEITELYNTGKVNYENYDHLNAYEFNFDEGEGYTTLGEDKNGNYGKSYTFDGVDDYVEIDNLHQISGSDTFTLSMWLSMGDINGNGYIYDDNRDIVFHQRGSSGGDIRGYITTTEGSFIIQLDSNLFSNDEWLFITMVYDGEKLKGYYNGDNGFSVSNNIDANGSIASTDRSYVLGRRDTTADSYWEGQIDDVLILDHALDANEIRTLYETSTYNTEKFVKGYDFDFEDLGVETTGKAVGGKFGKYLEFDGMDDYVAIENDVLEFVTEAGTYTTSIWIDVENLGPGSAYGNVWVNGNGGNNRNALLINDYGDQWKVAYQSYNGVYNGKLGYFDKGEQVHIAAVSTAGVKTLYINGVEQTEVGVLYQISPPTSQALWLNFDRPVQTNSYGTIEGSFDEFRVWDAALTQDEIFKEMHSAKPVRSANLKASYSFEGYDNVTVVDDNYIVSGTEDLPATINGGAEQYATDTIGTLVNGPLWDATRGIDFDGTADYIDTGIYEEQADKSFTLAAWVNKDVDGTTMAIVTKDFLHPGIYMSSDNTFKLTYTVVGTTVTASSTSTILAASGWTHVVATYDATDNSMKTYINGAADGAGATTDGTYDPDAVHSYLIGKYRSGPESWFNGQIDDVIILDHALTPAEVSSLYSTGEIDYTAIDHVQGYEFKMDEGAGTSTLGKGVSGVLGKSLVFDGVDDYVLFDPMAVDDFTACVWVSTEVSPSNMLIEGTVTPKTRIQLANNKMYLILYDSLNAVDFAISSSTVFDGDWNHLCYTLDDIAVKYYLNGVLDYSGDATLGEPRYFNKLGSTIGSTSYFKGQMDNVVILDYALNQTEITDLYNDKHIEYDELANGYEFNFEGDNIMTLGEAINNYEPKEVLGFDGVDDYVDLDIPMPGNDFTIGFKFITTQNADTVVMDKYGGSQGYTDRNMIGIQNGKIRAFCNSDGTALSKYSTGLYNDNNEHTVTITRSDTNVYIYVDGVLDSAHTGYCSGEISEADSHTVIGTYYDKINYWYQGKLDDIVILNQALNATEVLELYETGTLDYENLYDYRGTTVDLENPDLEFITGEPIFEREDRGVHFDGVDDYISVGSAEGLDLSLTNEYAISLWYNPESACNIDTLIKQRSTSNKMLIRCGANNRAEFYDWYSGTQHSVSGPATNLNTWNHIVAIRNDTAMHLYVNNELVTTINSIASGSVLTDNDFTISMGDALYNGDLDEIRIYNKSLSQQEVTDLYNEEYFKVSTDNLVANYDFNKHSNTEVLDVIDNQRHELVTPRFYVQNFSEGIYTNWYLDGTSSNKNNHVFYVDNTAPTLNISFPDTINLNDRTLNLTDYISITDLTPVTCNAQITEDGQVVQNLGSCYNASFIFSNLGNATVDISIYDSVSNNVEDNNTVNVDLYRINFTYSSAMTGNDIDYVTINESTIGNIGSTGNTSYYLTYINPGNYNFGSSKSQYGSKYTLFNKSNSTVFETLPITLGPVFNFSLLDEKDFGAFNISGAIIITLQTICEDSSVSQITITEDNFVVPINCEVEKLKFDLQYSDSSYFRTVRVDEDVLNQKVYLIDVLTTSAVTAVFNMFDLLNDYDDLSLSFKRNIEGTSQEITWDKTDAAGKVTAFLIQNEQYILEVESANQPIRSIGFYTATQSVVETLALFDLAFSVSQTVISDKVSVYSDQINGTVYGKWEDISGTTQEVKMEVRLDGPHGELVYTNTVVGQSSVELVYLTPAEYINRTLDVLVEGITDYGIVSDRDSMRENGEISLGLVNFNMDMNWIITIFLGFLALTLTAKSATAGSLVLSVVAAMMVYFGWFALSWVAISAAILLAILSMLREGEKQ